MGCIYQKICSYMINHLLTYPLSLSIEAIPKGYFSMHDNLVVGVLVLTALATAVVLGRSHKFFYAIGNEFLFGREQVSLFANSTGTDLRCMLLLFVQFCVLTALALEVHFVFLHPEITTHISIFWLLAIYVAACLLYLLVKLVIYRIVGWIFFNASITQLWLEAYITLLLYMGILLLPAVAAMVFVTPTLYATIAIGAICLLFAKLLTFYKWIKLFSENSYGILLLFLYFCALEIMPCLIFYKGLVELNSCWIIKY